MLEIAYLASIFSAGERLSFAESPSERVRQSVSAIAPRDEIGSKRGHHGRSEAGALIEARALRQARAGIRRTSSTFGETHTWRSISSSTSGSTATRPTPNLRGKTQIKEFSAFPDLEELPLWGFDGSSTKQAEGHSSDCVLKPVAVYPGSGAQERRARHVRSHDARRQDAASLEQARDDPRRSRRLVRLRAGVLPLQGRPPARLPRGRAIPPRRAPTTPASATRTSATSPARSSRSISISASPPASTTKASTPKWPRASGNSRSSARAPRRPPTKCGWPATSCSACARSTASTSSTIASRSAIPTGTARACTANFSTTYMREVGGKDYFEKLMAAFEQEHERTHRRLWPGQSPAPDRPARDAVDRQVQLRRRRSRRLGPRAAQLRQQRLQGLSGRSPSELPGRPLPDRVAGPEDDRLRSDRGQRLAGRLSTCRGAASSPGAATRIRSRTPV